MIDWCGKMDMWCDDMDEEDLDMADCDGECEDCVYLEQIRPTKREVL